MAVTGLRLFGVAVLPHRSDGALAPRATVIRHRDLGAIVRQAPYEPVELSDRELEDHRAVVEAVFERHTILPAPFGAVFRSADQVARWLQMHYIALTEGIHLVDGRCEMRVHIRAAREPKPAGPGLAAALEGDDEDDDDDDALDLRPEAAAAAAESFRALRRQAVAAVPLRQAEGDAVLSGAFLVERAQWGEFVEIVAAQAKRAEGLAFEQSGPWPPYDFVRMDLRA
jgi:hypothetical protein